ncbi:hypothetical protein EYF80_035946 [Liparis tanakae]|uniref:Uncharacterized protein n=1 Tax=Liparis tanakae TaxID=230148 RepID=A0A4Z2GKW1_9TELE|nr:hypothetical protein EYF80_035946 [Liparis tanakae]
MPHDAERRGLRGNLERAATYGPDSESRNSKSSPNIFDIWTLTTLSDPAPVSRCGEPSLIPGERPAAAHGHICTSTSPGAQGHTS